MAGFWYFSLAINRKFNSFGAFKAHVAWPQRCAGLPLLEQTGIELEREGRGQGQRRFLSKVRVSWMTAQMGSLAEGRRQRCSKLRTL